MSRLASCSHPRQGKEFAMPETSALQGLSKLPLAHQDAESGAEVMKETRETGLHPTQTCKAVTTTRKRRENLDQEQKAPIAACVYLQLFLDPEQFVLTPEIATNKTTPDNPPHCTSDTWQQPEPPHRAGWGRRVHQRAGSQHPWFG